MRANWIVAILMIGILVSCAPADEEANTSDPVPITTDQELPEVTVGQAEAAIGDAMLAASTALYTILTQGGENRISTSADGALSVTWNEEADFATGTGRFRITLNDFSIKDGELFAEFYHGYLLTGAIALSSSDAESTTLLFDLRARHPERSEFPVESVNVTLTGVTPGPGSLPLGRIRVNGRDMEIENLATAFQAP